MGAQIGAIVRMYVDEYIFLQELKYPHFTFIILITKEILTFFRVNTKNTCEWYGI